jgi:hypothetical protein
LTSSLSVSVLSGSQEPTAKSYPTFAWTYADDAAFLASKYGLTPDPWQFGVIEAWLGVDESDHWSASRCGISCPRQNGKNGILEIVELFKMVGLGRKILHTAHEVKTARKAFLRLCSFFENDRDYPELAELVASIRKTNGQEAILLTNGGSVEFIARSKGSGRGFTVDDLVCDEAQHLTDEELEALLPTISAAPSRNPQTIYTGTPPLGLGEGEAFWRFRKNGLAGDDHRLAWCEWSVSGHPDKMDRKLWARTNPSLGIRLTETTISDEAQAMSPEGFARERLGQWPSELTSAVISRHTWERLAIAEAAPAVKTAFGVKFSADGNWVALGAARRTDGKPHVEGIMEHPRALGLDQVAKFVADRKSRAAAVVIDGRAGVDSLVLKLTELGVPKRAIVVPKVGDVVAAHSMMLNAVEAGQVTHLDAEGQQGLDEQVTSCKKREFRNGGFGWEPVASDGDVTLWDAVTLAFWGVMTTKRDPAKRQRVMI